MSHSDERLPGAQVLIFCLKDVNWAAQSLQAMHEDLQIQSIKFLVAEGSQAVSALLSACQSLVTCVTCTLQSHDGHD